MVPGLETPSLLERDTELAAIAASVDDTPEARGRVIVIEGPAVLREDVARMLALGRDFAALGGRNPAFHPWRSEAALGLLGLGERARARELAAEEVELAAEWGAPLAYGRALRAAGLVEQGRHGMTFLSDAVDVLAPSTARLEHAKALLELGAALRRANRRRDARKPLHEAVRASPR